MTTSLYYYNKLYTKVSLGTLVCDEKFLGELFLDKNYIEVICGDLIVAMMIIIISALFPLIMIRKIKPVNILKDKE